MPEGQRGSRSRLLMPASSRRWLMTSPAALALTAAGLPSLVPAMCWLAGCTCSVIGSRSSLIGGTISHLQTLPAFRGQAVGSALMRSARQIARQEIGLEQLHLAARGGIGLERFHARLGWRETGRWPGALRLAPGDDRDEVLMILAPLGPDQPHHSRHDRTLPRKRFVSLVDRLLLGY